MRTYVDHDEDPPSRDVVDGVYGYWCRDNTPEGAGRWFFIPDSVEGENSGERIRRVTKELARADTPEMKRTNMKLAAADWLREHPDDKPVLRVRCNATSESERRCRSRIASVHKTPSGYLLWDAYLYPFHESTIASLESAMTARAVGDPLLEHYAAFSEAAADLPLPIGVNLSNPQPTQDMGDGVPRVIFGCEHHGNIAIAVETILAAAKLNARRGKVGDLLVNAQDGPVHGLS